MNFNKVRCLFCRRLWRISSISILVATAIGLGLLPKGYSDDISPGGGNTNSPPSALEAWPFQDNVTWTNARGYAPVSFTNLSFSYLGDGASLVVNSNAPAWIQYKAIEADGTTNLTVDIGSITFWFAPNWASTNAGGSGPGEWGRLIEAGGYSPDSSYGLWSIYVDDVGQNIYFSAQTNDLSSNLTTYVSAPISWTTNYWHYIALTYSRLKFPTRGPYAACRQATAVMVNETLPRNFREEFFAGFRRANGRSCPLITKCKTSK